MDDVDDSLPEKRGRGRPPKRKVAEKAEAAMKLPVPKPKLKRVVEVVAEDADSSSDESISDDEEPPQLMTLSSPVERNAEIIAELASTHGRGSQDRIKEFMQSPAYHLNAALEKEVQKQVQLVGKVVNKLVQKVPEAFRTSASIHRYYNAVIRHMRDSGKFRPFELDEIEEGCEISPQDGSDVIRADIALFRDQVAGAFVSEKIAIPLGGPLPALLQKAVDEQTSTNMEIMAYTETEELVRSMEYAKKGGTASTWYLLNSTVSIRGRVFTNVNVTLDARYPLS